MPDEQAIAANRLENRYYDSTLPTGCYFIVGRPLSELVDGANAYHLWVLHDVALPFSLKTPEAI